jgi:hypothetical protein
MVSAPELYSQKFYAYKPFFAAFLPLPVEWSGGTLPPHIADNEVSVPLSEENKKHENAPFHYEGNTPVFDLKSEREDRERAAQKEKEDTYKNKQLSIQRSTLTTQVALVAFGLIGAAISMYQSHISRVSAEAALEAANVAQRTLCETQRSNREQAAISKTSLEATVENFHQEQRAWVVPFDMSTEKIEDGKKVIFKVLYKNTDALPPCM